MNRLVTECTVSEAWDPNGTAPSPTIKTFLALWDTGATRSSITQNIVASLGLIQTTFINVEHAGGLTRNVPVYLVNIGLPNRVQFMGVEVAESKLPAGIDAIIGMDIIARGDFAVTNRDGNTVFSFRIPSQALIDFVNEDNKANLLNNLSRPSESKRQQSRRKRNRRKKNSS